MQQATVCAFHPDRETGRHCTRCGRPACSQCLVQAAVGSQCVACVREQRPPATERVRRWNATKGSVVANLMIAANLAVFVLTATKGGTSSQVTTIHRDFALYAPDVADGEWYRMFTAGFLHFGLFHVAMNCFFIWQFGNLLEPALGRVRFALVYLAALLAGSAGAIIASPHALSAGASTAAFGLLGAAAIGLRQRGVNIWQTGIGLTLVLNLGITLLVPGISIGGHLGGLVGGGLCGALMFRKGRSPKLEAADVLVPLAIAVASIAIGVIAAQQLA